MLKIEKRHPAIQTLRGQAILVRPEAGAICEREERGWIQNKADPTDYVALPFVLADDVFSALAANDTHNKNGCCQGFCYEPDARRGNRIRNRI
jgi:hypothetical protein